jgi:hypothetical protein
MVHRLVDRGLAPSKIWAFAASATELFWTETPYCSDGRAQWWYHVAPVLTVRGPGGDAQEMVFDPILFDRPVVVDEWRNALHDTPSLIRTTLGEPPLPANGGSGYWPGLDPLEGPDIHARETLEDYRQGNS